MCTVSHCHKLLPSLYRYKRCEQHRLQNRYHSKLKRVREKVVKAEGPTGQEECLVVDVESEDKDNDNEVKEVRKKRMRKKCVKVSVKEVGGGKEATGEGGSNADKSSEALSTHEGEKEDEKKVYIHTLLYMCVISKHLGVFLS
jgi:hypothetical protein